MPAFLFAFAFLLADPAIRLESAATGQAMFRITGQSDPAKFELHVASAEAGLPAMSGTFRTEGADLIFVPRYPLQPGLKYRAVWKSEPEVSAVFEIPAAKPAPPVVVEHVYPTAAVLPENQLKFYVHFSGPMAEEDSYRWIHLLRSNGSEVETPFLLLGEELWDPDGKRFTLLFNPGRVKRDLVPNKEMGPPLEAGQSYTLVIDAGWQDAQGRPLREGFRKSFRVGAADRKKPDPKSWKITPPSPGTQGALELVFPEPMEHALAGRMIEVIGPSGRSLPGKVELTAQETRWRFTPRDAWQEGPHALRVDTALEDLAGNRIARPFEVELDKGRAQETAPRITIPFAIGHSR